jgi:hypothetical protein
MQCECNFVNPDLFRSVCLPIKITILYVSYLCSPLLASYVCKSFLQDKLLAEKSKW